MADKCQPMDIQPEATDTIPFDLDAPEHKKLIAGHFPVLSNR
jgi:hypothetical protein